MQLASSMQTESSMQADSWTWGESSSQIPIMDLTRSNTGLTNLVKSGNKFLVSRFGSEIGVLALAHHLKRLPSGTTKKDLLRALVNNAGIYCKSEKDITDYAKLYFQILKHSTAIAYFPPMTDSLGWLHFAETNFYKLYPTIPSVCHKVIEPFLCGYGEHNTMVLSSKGQKDTCN